MSTARIAKQQLDLKLALEPRLKREMGVLFASISKDMRSEYSVNGAILQASEYQSEVEQILKQHYRRVSKIFGISLRQAIAKYMPVTETKAIDEEVDANMREFISETAATRSALIIKTTQKDIESSFEFALSLVAGNAAITTIDNSIIAKDAQKEVNRKFKGRTETIAITETQTAAEGSKDIEAATIAVQAAVIANLPQDKIIQKEWVAVLDSRTRTAHVLAGGQRRPANEPFDVDGERLKYPSDTSLGASAANVINCRCIAATVVKDAPIVEAIDSRIKPQAGRPNATVTGIVGL